MHEALRRPAGLTLVPLHIGWRATLRPSNHRDSYDTFGQVAHTQALKVIIET